MFYVIQENYFKDLARYVFYTATGKEFLDRAKFLVPYRGKKHLVFTPTKYLNQEHLDALQSDFAQLPFEIYRLAE